MKNKKLLCKIALVSCGYGIFSDSVIVPVLSSIYAEFPGSSTFLNNFIVTGGYLFSLLASLLTGVLLKYISKRKLLIGGSICFFIGGVGGFFCKSMEFLAFMRMLDGISDGVLAVTALSMIMELYADEKERSTMVGLYSAVSAACGVLLSFSAGVVAGILNWRYVFLLNGISIFSVILTILAVPETPVTTRDKEKHSAKFVFHSSALGVIVSYFICSALYCILFVFVDLYVQEKQFGSSMLSGTISSLGSMVTFFTGVVFSVLYTKLKKASSFVCYTGLGIMYLVLYQTRCSGAAVVSYALASLCYSYLYSYYQMQIGTMTDKEDTGSYMSILNSSYNIACFISSYIPYCIMNLFKLETIYESFMPISIFLFIAATYYGISFVWKMRSHK